MGVEAGPGDVEREAGAALDRLIEAHVALDDRSVDARVRAFVPSLRASGDGVAAVVLYGSFLSPATVSLDSEPDFYVVVDSLRRYHRRRDGLRGVALGALLPPSVYHLRLEGDEPRGPRSAKVCVLSTAQLTHDTSPAAADLHQLGRFSKRVALVWSRDEAARRFVRDAQRSALEVMADHALHLVSERFTLRDFVLTFLGLSYRGEPRIAEPGKVERLYRAAPEFYTAAAALLLAERGLRPLEESLSPAPAAVAPDGPDALLPPPPLDASYRAPAASERRRQRALTLALLAQSRARERLRWPKYLLTFDGWLDYLLRKLARQHADLPELTPRQRKHPLLLAWPALLDLRRRGLLT